MPYADPKKRREYEKKNREKKREYMKIWKAANKERVRIYHRAYCAEWRDRNREKLSPYQANWAAANMTGPCPLCHRIMWVRKSRRPLMCTECFQLAHVVFGQCFPSRQKLTGLVEDVLKGDLRIWQNVITLRKAIRPLQKLLKQQRIIPPSPTSGRNQKSFNS